jgi:hypothetical protein
VVVPRPRRASLRRRLYVQIGVLAALWSFTAWVTVGAGLSLACNICDLLRGNRWHTIPPTRGAWLRSRTRGTNGEPADAGKESYCADRRCGGAGRRGSDVRAVSAAALRMSRGATPYAARKYRLNTS